MSSRPEVFRREREKTSAEAGIYRFPSQPYPHSILLVFEEFSYDIGYSNKGSQEYVKGLLNANKSNMTGRSSGIDVRSRRSVELPFPKQLQDSSSITLNGFGRDPLVEQAMNELSQVMNSGGGTLGGIPETLQGMGADLARSLGAAASGGFGGAVDSFASTLSNYGVKDVVGATRYLLQKVSPMLGEMGQSLNLAAGQVLNPRETLAFEGVQLRTHEFTWDLYPNNVDDSNQIKQIVNIMKRSVLPSTIDFAIGSFEIERAFLKYPHICKVYLIGVDPDAFPKFKPCLVSNLRVDYGAGGGVSMMKGGRPAGVSLSVSLQELAIETAQDYGEPPEPRISVEVDESRFLNNFGGLGPDAGMTDFVPGFDPETLA